ncbi:MAG: hypothetical protein ACTHMX_06785 [Thermomicrobiales bacterium]
MFLRSSSSRHDRFSNRQAAVFMILVVLGLVAGWFLGSVTGGMMVGGIAGACGIMLPGVRPRDQASAPSGPDATPDDA